MFSDGPQNLGLFDTLVYKYSFLRAAAKRVIFRVRWQHAVALVALIVLVYLSALLWMEVEKRFPVVPQGSYLGNIYDLFDEKDGRPVKFYVERIEKDGALFIAVFKKGWMPQLVAGDVIVDERSGSRWLYPVILEGPNARLRFIGNEVEPGRFGGVVHNLNDGQEGTWKLRVIGESATQAKEMDSQNLVLWLRLKAELEDVENEIISLEEKLSKNKEEIEGLSDMVTDGVVLREEGDARYKDLSAEYHVFEKTLNEKRAEAKGLEEKVTLSQRLTKMGKLVSLSREAFQRENRWIDSMLKAPLEHSSVELKQAVDRGKEILEIKESIAAEQERIKQLEGRPESTEGTRIEAGESSFNSIWDR